VNREEIQTQCLELPEAERAALAQRLADSLGDARRIQALRDHLEALEKAKMEALRQKLGAEMATCFKGPSVEMPPEAWQPTATDSMSPTEKVYPWSGQAEPAVNTES